VERRYAFLATQSLTMECAMYIMSHVGAKHVEQLLSIHCVYSNLSHFA